MKRIVFATLSFAASLLMMASMISLPTWSGTYIDGNVGDAIITVMPTGVVASDQANLTWACANVADDGLVKLEAGTFNLGKKENGDPAFWAILDRGVSLEGTTDNQENPLTIFKDGGNTDWQTLWPATVLIRSAGLISASEVKNIIPASNGEITTWGATKRD